MNNHELDLSGLATWQLSTYSILYKNLCFVKKDPWPSDKRSDRVLPKQLEASKLSNRSQRDTQKEASMDKCINFRRFLRYLLDDEDLIEKGARITKALLEAQSPRLTDISEKMPGNHNSRYKEIQRFLKKVDLKQALMRLYQEDAEYVIGDPTEMERYKAPKTSYVGTLKDRTTAGYWLLVLSTPFRGRSLPFSFVVYSLNASSSSSA